MTEGEGKWSEVSMILVLCVDIHVQDHYREQQRGGGEMCRADYRGN